MERTHHVSSQNLGWSVLTIFLVTCSVMMLTDFSHRLLGADPDSIGISAIAVQALFAIAATSTFTEMGRASLKALFSRWQIAEASQGKRQTQLALAATLVIFLIWILVPHTLAVLYNNRAYRETHRENQSTADPGQALQNYLRAVSLNPKLAEAHFNLGELYEDFYQYDKAIEQYKQAIVASHNDARSYNNLARVLLLQNNATDALRVLNGALRPVTADVEVHAALLKNRGWAEYLMGFNECAIADVKSSIQAQPSAASYCMLGKIYSKLGKQADSQQAWAAFLKLSTASQVQNQPSIEPDCYLLAQGFKK